MIFTRVSVKYPIVLHSPFLRRIVKNFDVKRILVEDLAETDAYRV